MNGEQVLTQKRIENRRAVCDFLGLFASFECLINMIVLGPQIMTKKKKKKDTTHSQYFIVILQNTLQEAISTVIWEGRYR